MLFAICVHIYMCACVQLCRNLRKKRTRGGEFCFLREGQPLPYGVGEYQPIYSITLNSGRQGCRPLLKKDNKMLPLDAEIFERLCKWKQHKFEINIFACLQCENYHLLNTFSAKPTWPVNVITLPSSSTKSPKKRPKTWC